MIRVQQILSNNPKLEHIDLLAYVLKKTREWVLAHPEAIIHPTRVLRFRKLCSRLQQGEPFAQIICEQWFYGRPFIVNRDVLIPRPETELLVELAIRECKMQNAECRIIDIGTGSGCIAVTIAAELPNARVIAIDTSPATLRVARKNARRNGVSNRIHFLHSDLLQSYYTQKYDRIFGCSFNVDTPIFIIANPPYLTSAEWHALPRSLKHYEPRSAFDGGRDGLKPFHELFEQLAELAACGPDDSISGSRSKRRDCRLTTFLEIDPRRKIALAKLVRIMLPNWYITWHRDLAKRWRVIEIRAPST